MWQPSASIDALRQRGQLMAVIRDFFFQRDVLEVETPCLSQMTVTDQHLSSFSTKFVGPGFANGQTLYLQTSPEFAMKRLLAAGSGCIYQIGKAFRNEEAGRFHNPEFTMLEWYRLGFDHFALMDEVEALIVKVLGCPKAERMSYQQAFKTWVGLDPLEAATTELYQAMKACGLGDIADVDNNRDTWLQCLFTHRVEVNIGLQQPCFIYDFPASQASLAKISPSDPRVAERFELYYQGIELANGFHELTDATEQRVRFEADNKKRLANGVAANEIDSRFLAALSAGLPPCAGVALGIDRLIMLALSASSIDEVISFTIKRA